MIVIDFHRQMSQRCTQDDLLYPLTDFFIRSQDKLAAMQHKRYNNDMYRVARAAAGGHPDPALEDTVSYIVDHMLREGIIRPFGEETARDAGAASRPA
jgi:hypothetical protein